MTSTRVLERPRRDLIHPSLGVNLTLMNAAKLRGDVGLGRYLRLQIASACAFVSIDCQSISSWCACGAIELSHNSCDCLFGTGTKSRMSSSYGCGLYGGSNWTISTSSRIIPRGNSVYGYLWTSVSRRNACDSRIPIVLFRTITEAKILEASRNGRNNDPNSRSSSLKLLQATNPICANSSYQCFWNVWNQSVNQLWES